MSDSAVLFLELAAIAIVFAGIPLAYLFSRPSLNLFQRLNWTIVFLTFDLIVFGAFTRLSDSGLGCPDWPGCYGTSNPFRAMEQIRLAEAAMPDGPVTEVKAWIEMLHRYLAMTVGALIVLQVGLAIAKVKELGTKAVVGSLVFGIGLLARRFWCMDGDVKITTHHRIDSFNARFNFISSAHLVCTTALAGPVALRPISLLLSGKLLAVSFGILFWQVFLGAWVSTNYAVLACPDFPTCMGSFRPETDWGNAFTLWRELGLDAKGGAISTIALQTIHWTHRVFAIAVMLVLGYFAWHAWRVAGQTHPSITSLGSSRCHLAGIASANRYIQCRLSVAASGCLIAYRRRGCPCLVLSPNGAWASWSYSGPRVRGIA
jgi:heme a synthase